MPARPDTNIVGNAKNRLKFMRGYLCGAMDRASDGGAGWRIAMQQQLADLEIIWLDPTQKPTTVGTEDDVLRARVSDLKSAGTYNAILPIVKEIRAVDLRMVDISDFLVVNLDLEIHACGTYEELFLANRQKKPIIVHIEQGKQAAPSWLFATLPHEMFFSTWPEVHDYLRHVARDQVVRHFNRWLFFDFEMCRKFNK